MIEILATNHVQVNSLALGMESLNGVARCAGKKGLIEMVVSSIAPPATSRC